MKTLTEFSPLLLRNAAAARKNAPAAAAPAEAAPPPQEAAQMGENDGSGAEAADADAAPADAAPAEGGEGGGEAAAPAAAAAPDPAIDTVASTLGVQPDRAARLLEALDIIGDRIDQVRLVRVFQGEKGPHGAVSRGEFHYVIDRVAGQARGGAARSDDRGGRGGDRGDRGGRGGGGGGDRGGRGGGGPGGPGGPRGDRDKPRGLGSLVKSAGKPEEKKEDDRPGRGEMPRAGIGWQLTAAPRDERGPGRGGPGRGRGDRDRRGRGPGGPRGPGGGGGPGGRGPRGPRREGEMGAAGGPGGPGGGGGDRGPRGPRPDRGPRGPRGTGGPGHGQQDASGQNAGAPREPRLGPDGQPLPPRSKRPRKPIGPDANGLGPDGKPWDPERRAKRQAERATQGGGVNNEQPANVEGQTPSANQSETPTE